MVTLTPARSEDALLLLISGALVFLIVPGVALFYGGMSGRSAAADAVRAAFAGAAVVVVIAVVGGYGLIAGPALIPMFLGRPDWGLSSLVATIGPKHGDPYPLAHAGYVLALCAVAVAILGAAVASRVTLRAWLLFVAAWSVLVLFPACYGVFSLKDGWAIAGMHAIDFGGAIPVSLAAGSAAAGVILASGRQGHPPTGSHSLPLVAAGGALVWCGWFGLTLGSEGAVDAYLPLIWVNTLVASAAGVLIWILVDRVMLRRPTITSALLGAVSGLVAITPASGVLTPGWSLLLGALAALACASMVDVASRARFGVPMAIGVIHIVGSLVGLLFVGLFSGGGGMIESGNFDLFIAQAIAGFGSAAWSFFVALGVALLLRVTTGLTRTRKHAKAELSGRDLPEDEQVVTV